MRHNLRNSIPPSRLGYQDLADQILCCPSPWSQNGCKLEARNRAPARTTLADAFPFAIREAEVRIQDELQEVVGVVRVKWQRSTQTGHTQLLVLLVLNWMGSEKSRAGSYMMYRMIPAAHTSTDSLYGRFCSISGAAQTIFSDCLPRVSTQNMCDVDGNAPM
jgi:hypothetical protein